MPRFPTPTVGERAFRFGRSPHDRQILRLAVPALGALVAEPLFLLADSAIVGHLGTRQLAGLGVASTALSTLVYLCVFLAYGTTGAVARMIGAGDIRGAVRQGIDGMWLAVLLGAGLLVAGLLGAPALVRALGASPAVEPYAATYLRISAIGVPSMLLVLAATGILRGLQDTKTPLVVAVAGFSANALLNYLLVYPAGLGIAGSALGTVIAQTGMATAYVVVVLRAARNYGAGLRPDWPGIRRSATAAGPLLIRTLMLRIYLVVSTWIAARSGTTALAAHQVASALWSFLALSLDAVAIAAQAIVGQYLGAGDTAGARACVRRMLEWGAGVGVLFGALLLIGRPLYVPLFTTDHHVRALLSSVLVLAAVYQPICGPVFVLDGVLIGAGDGPYLAWVGTVNTVVFIAVAEFSYARNGGLMGLWWAIGAYMLARLVSLWVRERGTGWMVTGARV